MTIRIKNLMWAVALSPILATVTVQANSSNTAPEATAEEAALMHWRIPNSERSFFDIPELEHAYISTSPDMRSDGIPTLAFNSDSTNKSKLIALAEEMATGELGTYDSLLIAQHGKLIFESYFKRGRIDLPHPQSSASKVYISTILGRAIQLGYLTMADLDKPLIDFLPALDRSLLTQGADKITLRHALTMQSGIRIEQSQWDNFERKPEAMKGQGLVQAYLELSAPITDESQSFLYQNDPMLVMQVVEAVVPTSAKVFIEQEVLGKMGITHYGWQTDEVSGLPGSASMTSRAMLKFGLLAESNGKWGKEQLVPKGYLAEAMAKQVITGDDDVFGGGKDVTNQGYGFYWWSTDLHYGGKRYPSVSAQGGGGMYVMLIESLDLIVVVTAHHRDDKTQQLIAERVLPVFVSEQK